MATTAPPLRHTSASLAERIRPSAAVVAASCGVGIAIIALFGRLMTYPLGHDEQMYLPAGALLGEGDLYLDFGFNNLPNLPLLLHMVFDLAKTDHYLLTGRLVIFAGWLMSAAAIALLVNRFTGSRVAAALAALLLMTNPTLLGSAGMLVSNNFLPLPFALLATAGFIAGVDGPRPRPLLILGGGICLGIAAGFKANYVFLLPPFAIAALTIPQGIDFVGRCRTVVAPLATGCIVGGLPVLFYLARGADGFIAHVLRYHRGPHVAYWAANASLDGPKVVTLLDKIDLAVSVWCGGATWLILLAGLWCAWLSVRPRNTREPATKPVWPIVFIGMLVVGGMLISFVPTPAFPQYYVAPIAFGILLVALLFGRLPARSKTMTAPLLVGAALGTILVGSPRLLVHLPDLVRPERWTGNRVHAIGTTVAALTTAQQLGNRIATLAPIYALEGGLTIYPELAGGPFIYRVGDMIPAGDRRYYRLVSPTTLAPVLDAMPPAAILVGMEGALDDPFVAYAKRHGYRRIAEPLLHDRYGSGILYLRERTP